jgi:hypothetical protein
MADDTKPNEAGLALLNAQMDSLAREVGAFNRQDPKRADLVKEIFRLTELAAEWRLALSSVVRFCEASVSIPTSII